MKTFGIDAHGHAKGLHIAEVAWGSTTEGPHAVTFHHAPLRAAPSGSCPLLDIEIIRPLAAAGNVEELAAVTYSAAAYLSGLLFPVIAGAPSKTIAIDSPSAFSRNTKGHGRLTEKLRSPYGFRGAYQIYPQMTPTLNCKKPHNGSNWSWMIFGMAAFATAGQRMTGDGGFSAWRAYLDNGPDGDEPMEAFPSATIQFLRQPENAAAKEAIEQLLDAMQPAAGQAEEPLKEVRQIIKSALDNGPKWLKDDRAAALVAALSTLPTVYPDEFRVVVMHAPDGAHKTKHQSSNLGHEGSIVLVDLATKAEDDG